MHFPRVSNLSSTHNSLLTLIGKLSYEKMSIKDEINSNGSAYLNILILMGDKFIDVLIALSFLFLFFFLF